MPTRDDHSNSQPAEALAATSTSLQPDDDLRGRFSRTPRPYLLSHLPNDDLKATETGESVQHDVTNDDPQPAEKGSIQPRQRDSTRENRQDSIAGSVGSESGTEADDERPSFVKALPPATIRLRKGLKTGEQNADALLTPSQLDEREKGYFARNAAERSRRASVQEQDQQKKEWDEFQKRRFAEFLRRSSEIALMGVILLCVLCGNGAARTAWQWKRELLAHGVTIAVLIIAYPIKLSIVDAQATHTRIWQRFRVPASFDPATVLYPPLLPVLVALSIAPSNPAVVLPNIILGLASLPQRLFPRSSRLGQLNAVHWLISVIPLIVSEHTDWPSKARLTIPYLLKTNNGLTSETLVSLYPLHHALLVPLHYLTTSSLLVSELHLLSATLINLLLLAESPQMVILKACLWIGGVSLFVACGPVLHWNVTLARVPRWKLRRPGHTAEERKSLVDAVSDLINLQRAAGAFTSSSAAIDSDADEDEPSKSLKQPANKSPQRHMPRINTAGLVFPSFNMNMFETKTAFEPRQIAHGVFPDLVDPPKRRPRRNTVPEREAPSVLSREQSTKKPKSTNLLWCLQLTPEQAWQRKWIYAGFTYTVVVALILAPVRIYVAQRALSNHEPIGWALAYLISQIPPVYSSVENWNLSQWVPLSFGLPNWSNLSLNFPPNIPLLRSELGPANIRLALIAYWLLVLLVGLLAVFSLTAFVEVDTRRKVFHGVMVAMLLPATFVDPCYCALALALILAIFLLLEVIRAGQVPPLGNAISRFVAPYVDGRDLRGPVVVSHIFLLIGCAVPLWFSLASIDRAGSGAWEGWDLENDYREGAMIAGVVCVGMGDAAASLIGRRFGRHKWIWVGGKSIEGSAAFAAAVTIGLVAARVWQEFGGWNDHLTTASKTTAELMWKWAFVLFRAVFCACGASFMEAVLTGANDNVVVPVALWLLVKGCRL